MVVLGDTLPDIADTIRLLTDYFDLASKRLDDLGRDRDSEGRPRALVPSDPGALAQALAERTPVPGAPAPNFGALRLIPTERAFTDKARMEWRAQFGLFAAGSEADAQKVMLEETARLLKIKVPDERG